MLVVGVIGLLSLIALPSFVKARQSARVKACVSNLRAMDWAKTEWALELRRSDTAIPTAAEVIPYLKGGRIPDCPALGTYRLRRVSRTPKCSLYESGHTLNNLNLDEDRAPD
jgi:hypothetical protein